MKNVFSLLFAFGLILGVNSCSGDDEGSCSGIYSEGECIPGFVFPPIIDNVAEGQKFYHKKYSVIIFNNGNWMDEAGNIITKNELLIE